MSSGAPSQQPTNEASIDYCIEKPTNPLIGSKDPRKRDSPTSPDDPDDERATNPLVGSKDPRKRDTQDPSTKGSTSPPVDPKDPRKRDTQDPSIKGLSSPSVGSKEPRKKTSQTLTEQINQKLDDLLQWLDGPDYTIEHQALAALHARGTYSWFYSTGQYMKWENETNSFLWVQGKAGSGKSVLIHSVIEHFKATEHPVLYFYCGFRDDKPGTATRIMTSLLCQILHSFRNDFARTRARSTIDALISQRSRNIPIDIQSLPPLLASAAKELRQRPVVIIDALDQCEDDEKLLDALTECYKSGYIRLIVTSRPLQIIKDKLRVISSISVISWKEFEEGMSTDISTFIEKELDSCGWFGNVDAESQRRAKKILLQKAEGMFLWAKHQVEMFTRCSNISKAWESLKMLPVPIQDLYDRIVLDIDEQRPEPKVVRRVLVWLISALRPIRLREVSEALTIDLNRQTMEQEQLRRAINVPAFTNIPGPRTLEVEVGVALLHILRNLVTHDEETDHITFLHSSIKIYLTDSSTNPRYYLDLRDTHEELATTCACYLSLCLSGSLVSINDKPPFHIPSGMDAKLSVVSHYPGSPLLDYVLTTSFNHLAFLLPDNGAVLGYLLTLESDIQKHSDAWNHLCKFDDRAFPWPSTKHDFVIYMLIAFAPALLLDTFLDRHPLPGRPKRFQDTNPLIYAVRFHAVDHARVLLSRGADPQNQGLLVDDSSRVLPFVAAVQAKDGSSEIFDIFSKWGIPVPPDLFIHLVSNPSSMAVPVTRKLLVDHAQICRHDYLSSSGWVVKDPSQVLPPTVAVQVKVKPSGIVDLFLARCSSNSLIDFVSSLGPSGFALPTTRGLLQTDELAEWLETHQDQRPSFHSFIPADLSSIGEEELFTMVWRLVQLGLDPGEPSPLGKTIFHLASASGYLSIVEYLVAIGTTLPDDILFSVLKREHWNANTTSVVCYLVEHDANVHSRISRDGGDEASGDGASGDNALHAAVRNAPSQPQEASSSNTTSPLEEILTVLVDAGCDPNTRNVESYTPLHLAIVLGQIDAVQYLFGLPGNSVSEELTELVYRAPPSAQHVIREILFSGSQQFTAYNAV